MGFLDFLTGIGSIFQEIGALLNAIFVTLWNIMAALFNFLWGVLGAIVKAVVAVFQDAGKFINHLWTDYLKPAINGIFTAVGKAFTLLHKILDPVLKWIQKIRQWYDTHILPILLKEIQMIQRIRQFLALLRILHVKWAQTLDALLAQAQGRITTSIELVRGYLNQIISWIALVTDPSMIIRRNTLGAWLLANLGVLKRVAGYGGNKPISAADQASLDAARTRYYTANVQAHVQTLLLTGPTQQDIDERAAARSALEEATGASLPA
jgi:hypothetical protein